MKAQSNALQRGESPDAKEFTVYAELLSMAHDEGLKSIQTQILAQPTEENGHRCIVKAIVEVERGHFEGLGDADPGNVEDFLAPHLIRVAETRAKARALRDAVNVGVISFEELDGVSLDRDSNPGSGATASSRPVRNGRNAQAARPRGNGQARPTRGNGNGSPEPMSEAQRRYLFRLLAGQGLHKEGAEEHLKDLFQVDSLASVTKQQAMKVIDQLLNPAPAGERSGGGASAF
jgi:hypothetical protein